MLRRSSAGAVVATLLLSLIFCVMSAPASACTTKTASAKGSRGAASADSSGQSKVRLGANRRPVEHCDAGQSSEGPPDTPSCYTASIVAAGSEIRVNWPDRLKTDDLTTANGGQDAVPPPAGQAWTDGKYLFNECTGQWVWVRDGQPPPPDPQDLAVQAAASVTVTTPPMQVNPAWTLADGRKATMKNAYTWVWAEKSTWRTLKPRVVAGAVWAEATITPRTIIIAPNDGGSKGQQCQGSGTPLPKSTPLSTPSPSCSIQLTKQTTGQTWPMTMQVQFSVTWTGSTGTDTVGGTLPDLTSAPVACPIAVLAAKTQLIDASQPAASGLKLKPGATLAGWCGNP